MTVSHRRNLANTLDIFPKVCPLLCIPHWSGNCRPAAFSLALWKTLRRRSQRQTWDCLHCGWLGSPSPAPHPVALDTWSQDTKRRIDLRAKRRSVKCAQCSVAMWGLGVCARVYVRACVRAFFSGKRVEGGRIPHRMFPAQKSYNVIICGKSRPVLADRAARAPGWRRFLSQKWLQSAVCTLFPTVSLFFLLTLNDAKHILLSYCTLPTNCQKKS